MWLPRGLPWWGPVRLNCTGWGGGAAHSRVGGARGSGLWMHPAPSKATQPPLASNLPGFWQILLHQVLRTEALLLDRVNSKTL